MQKPTSSDGLLIVLELGAEWPSLAAAPPSALAGVRRVIAQDDLESPGAFAVRVGEQVDSLFARGVALSSVVMACSERMDASARAARAELGRALANALARARGGSLLLFALDRNDGRSRQPLAQLRAELAQEWQSAAVDVNLRFANDAANSEAAPEEAKSRTSAKRALNKAGARHVA